MRVVERASDVFSAARPVMLGAGFFDGVHMGHRLVLQAAKKAAAAVNGEAWALTFDKHPLAVLAPVRKPLLLSSLEERLALLEAAGVDGVLLLPFTRELAVQTPEAFVASIFAEGAPHLGHKIFCGENWRFGTRAAGNPELLRALGAMYGFDVEIVPYAYYQNEVVSSTRIRKALLKGHVSDVRNMLGGRAWAVSGTVMHGMARGRKLDFPTANVPYVHECVPPYGVYAVRLKAQGRVFDGVANLGVHPTFEVSKVPLLEVYCFESPGDLYGQPVEIGFYSYIRAEQRFASVEALVAQIRQDVCVAREELKLCVK